MDWTELAHKVAYIRNLYRTKGVDLKSRGGLGTALAEAEALAAGDKLPGNPSAEHIRASAHDAHVIWALAENLEACDSRGLDVGPYLPQITTGTTNYGTPSASNQDIYYKDFECEVFIAAVMLRAGRSVAFPAAMNDPLGDIQVPPIRIEVKHPNSPKKLNKLLTKFNKRLEAANSYGVFAVGLEDVFEMADGTAFPDVVSHEEWLTAKREQMERFGMNFLAGVAARPRILAAIQTQTTVDYIGDSSQLRRLGNACVFDDRDAVPPDAWAAASEVATVFNPNPIRWTELQSE